MRSDLTSGAKHEPLADVAYVAYQLDGANRDQRPVTFVFNGGPGFASAWLQLGAVGPWRIPLGDRTTSPSATPQPQPNADTWLDFTDLVFIDPAGTGYSQALVNGEDARHKLWSVDGDIAYLAEAIRRWIDRYDRMLSPKYILGESYGGFRAPRLSYELTTKHGTGVRGLALISPALEITAPNNTFEPFYYVTRLPSMTAAARAEHGPVERARNWRMWSTMPPPITWWTWCAASAIPRQSTGALRRWPHSPDWIRRWCGGIAG